MHTLQSLLNRSTDTLRPDPSTEHHILVSNRRATETHSHARHRSLLHRNQQLRPSPMPPPTPSFECANPGRESGRLPQSGPPRTSGPFHSTTFVPYADCVTTMLAMAPTPFTSATNATAAEQVTAAPGVGHPAGRVGNAPCGPAPTFSGTVANASPRCGCRVGRQDEQCPSCGLCPRRELRRQRTPGQRDRLRQRCGLWR